MDKTIEQEYFNAFELGGVAEMCIDWIREKYDLGYLPNQTQNDIKKRLAGLSDEDRKKAKQNIKKWKQYYNKQLPEQIADKTVSFDFNVIYSGKISKIIKEIEANIQGCKTDDERERYLFSLLTPFKSISCIFYPIIEIKRLNLIHHKEEIDRLYYINKRFCDILGTETHKEGTVEYYTGCWIDSVFNYINRLDALLLTHGIDLLMIQKKCGICLKGYRSIHEIDYYIGSIELTQYYIDKLPQREPPNKPQEKDLPNELNTSEFRKIFRPSSSKEQ